MKKLCYLLLLVLCSCGMSPEEEYAVAFFKQKGVDLFGLDVVDSRGSLKVLSSKKAQKFIVLANAPWKGLLHDNLVLAYSLEHAWGTDSALPRILDHYEKMLVQIQSSKKYISCKEQPVFSPLLKTEWGQDAPFNSACPVTDGVSPKAGCLPVALAQLVQFYQKDKGKSPSDLIAETGHAAHAVYSPKNTVASTHRVKPVLVGNYGFSASCRLRVGMASSQIFELAVRNLAEGHVLLLSNKDHAFLCDGMEGDFLHLNMGFGGPYNGYYRLLYSDELKWEEPLASSVFTDLKTDEPIDFIVDNLKPGTLKDVLKENAFRIGSLRLSGTLNGEDVALLRRMAGAVDHTTAPIGCLTSLILVNVRYVNGDVFAVEDAVKNKFVLRQDGENYDFSNMSDSRWNYFCSKGYNKTADYRVEKEEGTFLLKFLLSPSPKSAYLFMDCENLKM